MSTRLDVQSAEDFSNNSLGFKNIGYIGRVCPGHDPEDEGTQCCRRRQVVCWGCVHRFSGAVTRSRRHKNVLTTVNL